MLCILVQLTNSFIHTLLVAEVVHTSPTNAG